MGSDRYPAVLASSSGCRLSYQTNDPNACGRALRNVGCGFVSMQL